MIQYPVTSSITHHFIFIKMLSIVIFSVEITLLLQKKRKYCKRDNIHAVSTFLPCAKIPAYILYLCINDEGS